MNTRIKEINLKKPLFGKEIEIVSYDLALKNKKESEILEILEEAYNYALALQRIFNFFDPDSELSKLNTERKISASKELVEVTKRAIELSYKTNGKYDISLGKSILERKRGKKESSSKSLYKSIEINGNIIKLKDDEMLVDLGSIAKGYIADKVAQLLKTRGIKEFMIDARGDILFSGEFEHVLEIQHPRDKKSSINKIKLRNKGVATSGDYNQFYGSYSNSHIINAGDLISLTVIADTLQEADLFSTALFVANNKEREKLIRDNKNIKAFSIDKNMRTREYNGFGEMVVR